MKERTSRPLRLMLKQAVNDENGNVEAHALATVVVEVPPVSIMNWGGKMVPCRHGALEVVGGEWLAKPEKTVETSND